MHMPWWSSVGSSRSPPGPPWWTRCTGWTQPGSSWSVGPALPAGWSPPEPSSERSGRPHGLHAAPGSPPESCTSPDRSSPPLRSQTSCWKPTPSWQRSGTSPRPVMEQGVKSLNRTQLREHHCKLVQTLKSGQHPGIHRLKNNLQGKVTKKEDVKNPYR